MPVRPKLAIFGNLHNNATGGRRALSCTVTEAVARLQLASAQRRCRQKSEPACVPRARRKSAANRRPGTHAIVTGVRTRHSSQPYPAVRRLHGANGAGCIGLGSPSLETPAYSKSTSCISTEVTELALTCTSQAKQLPFPPLQSGLLQEAMGVQGEP